MPIYVYETISSQPGEEPRYFEFKQSMADTPFTHHPETGEPIRRVVTGGLGVLSSKPTATAAKPAGSCGPSCGCHG